MTFLEKAQSCYEIVADKKAAKPRVHDPILLVHLGYQRPYARFGYVDRATGVLTYTKLGADQDPQAVIPQSWLIWLRKQHPMFKRHVATAEINLATIGPKVETLFIDFGYQTTYNPDLLEVKAPYDPSIKSYGGQVLEVSVSEDGPIDIALFPVKNPSTEEEHAINRALDAAKRIIEDYVK